jgi:hypothetical protein
MPRRPLSIDVKDLPPRATPLSEEAVSKVFGGCSQMWSGCNTSADCCPSGLGGFGYNCKLFTQPINGFAGICSPM